jgi:hypothetical protein
MMGMASMMPMPVMIRVLLTIGMRGMIRTLAMIRMPAIASH